MDGGASRESRDSRKPGDIFAQIIICDVREKMVRNDFQFP